MAEDRPPDPPPISVLPTSHLGVTRKTYAAVLGPLAGSPSPVTLPPPSLGSHKGFPSITFDDPQIHTLSTPFRYSLIGKFAKGYNKTNPKIGRPSTEDIHKHLVSMDFSGAFTVGLMDNRHAWIRFSAESDYLRLYSRPVWYINGMAMRIFKWTPYFRVDIESSLVPVWVKFPRLPLQFFQQTALFQIASLLGLPLRADSATVSLKRPSVARIQIEIDLLKPRHDKIWVTVGSGGGYWQMIEYESIPQYCTHCMHVGHTEQFCTVHHPELLDREGKQTTGHWVPKRIGSDRIEIIASQGTDRPAPASHGTDRHIPGTDLQAIPQPTGKERISPDRIAVPLAQLTPPPDQSAVDRITASPERSNAPPGRISPVRSTTTHDLLTAPPDWIATATERITELLERVSPSPERIGEERHSAPPVRPSPVRLNSPGRIAATDKEQTATPLERIVVEQQTAPPERNVSPDRNASPKRISATAAPLDRFNSSPERTARSATPDRIAPLPPRTTPTVLSVPAVCPPLDRVAAPTVRESTDRSSASQPVLPLSATVATVDPLALPFASQEVGFSPQLVSIHSHPDIVLSLIDSDPEVDESLHVVPSSAITLSPRQPSTCNSEPSVLVSSQPDMIAPAVPFILSSSSEFPVLSTLSPPVSAPNLLSSVQHPTPAQSHSLNVDATAWFPRDRIASTSSFTSGRFLPPSFDPNFSGHEGLTDDVFVTEEDEEEADEEESMENYLDSQTVRDDLYLETRKNRKAHRDREIVHLRRGRGRPIGSRTRTYFDAVRTISTRSKTID